MRVVLATVIVIGLVASLHAQLRKTLNLRNKVDMRGGDVSNVPEPGTKYCYDNYYPINGACYYFSKEATDIHTAYYACKNMGGMLYEPRFPAPEAKYVYGLGTCLNHYASYYTGVVRYFPHAEYWFFISDAVEVLRCYVEALEHTFDLKPPCDNDTAMCIEGDKDNLLVKGCSANDDHHYICQLDKHVKPLKPKQPTCYEEHEEEPECEEEPEEEPECEEEPEEEPECEEEPEEEPECDDEEDMPYDDDNYQNYMPASADVQNGKIKVEKILESKATQDEALKKMHPLLRMFARRKKASVVLRGKLNVKH